MYNIQIYLTEGTLTGVYVLDSQLGVSVRRRNQTDDKVKVLSQHSSEEQEPSRKTISWQTRPGFLDSLSLHTDALFTAVKVSMLEFSACQHRLHTVYTVSHPATSLQMFHKISNKQTWRQFLCRWFQHFLLIKRHIFNPSLSLWENGTHLGLIQPCRVLVWPSGAVWGSESLESNHQLRD